MEIKCKHPWYTAKWLETDARRREIRRRLKERR